METDSGLKLGNGDRFQPGTWKWRPIPAWNLEIETDIKPKFQMFSQSSNFEKVINLVKINTKKVIAIEFDNIKIESVKLDGIQSSWQKVTDISQLLLKKSDNEILSFEINDRYYPNQKNSSASFRIKD
ncbi:hypothetical protein RhiirA5_433481 [Rhizophagus irregularis]|uniref:Uncharacterized protein n=2 Tax=Rhizophagus irregularis TaxID=588596 RepID=A0A2N0NRP3_9GLOM|nr:hypothetical protein RhiirA5_433481 [Rhizophagus irregularis]